MTTKPSWLSQFLVNPRQTAAISPASRPLAKQVAAMALDHLPDNARVIEVGCGFGAITQALLDGGLSPDRLIAIDLSARATRHTAMLGVRAWRVDARYVHFLVRDLGWGHCDCIVSSLGLLSMRHPLRQDILESFDQASRPGGRLVQYTYGPSDPTQGSMARRQWRKTGQSFTWLNLPPAHVWRWTKPAR